MTTITEYPISTKCLVFVGRYLKKAFLIYADQFCFDIEKQMSLQWTFEGYVNMWNKIVSYAGNEKNISSCLCLHVLYL